MLSCLGGLDRQTSPQVLSLPEGKGAAMNHEESRRLGQSASAGEPGAILSIRLDAATVKVLRELARATGLSPAQLVQAWVRERARRELSRIPA